MSEREEEPIVKVTDKRKFNLDGSLREGVEFSSEKSTETIKIEETKGENFSAGNLATEERNSKETEVEKAEIPDADDPASFVNFLSTLATNAAAALGAMPHPATGKMMVDLDTGKYWIDVLAMIKEKTRNNLHPKELSLLEGILGDLRMQYVQLVRATEERLKAQAAQKFSAKDILGKK